MQMTPCRTCPFRESCDLREAKRSALRGLGLSSVKFKCEKLLSAFRPGTKVLAKLDFVATGLHVGCDSQEVETEKRVVEAYVMSFTRFTKGKVRIYVPYDETPSGKYDLPVWWLQKLNGSNPGECVHILRVQPERLEATGETAIACRHCGMPEAFEKPDGWTCRWYNEDHGIGYLERVQAECDFPEVQ